MLALKSLENSEESAYKNICVWDAALVNIYWEVQ